MSLGIHSVNGFQAKMINHYLTAQRKSAQAKLRISTGKKINSAADNPSGFAFITKQNARLASLQQAKQNTENAQGLAEVALGAMDEIENKLISIQANVQEALGGGLSQSELEVKQLEIDDAIGVIHSLVSSTEFRGRKLLQGSGETAFTSTVSGLNPSQVESLNLIKTDPQQPTQLIDVNVDSIVDVAELNYRGRSGQRVRRDAEFTLTGSLGSASFSVERDDSLQDLRNEINASSDSTGVTASLSGNDLRLSSVEPGSDQMVEVDVNSGTFNVTGGNGNGTAVGTDTVATINGQSIAATNGDTFHFRSSDLDFDLVLEPGFGVGPLDRLTVSNETMEPTPSTFSFQLGANVGNTGQLQLASLDVAQLGGPQGSLDDLRSGGSNSVLGGNAADALSITQDAQAMLQSQQARLGSFINTTLESTISMLTVQEENTLNAIATVESANIAEETAIQIKNDILAEQSLKGLLEGVSSFSSLPEVLGFLV